MKPKVAIIGAGATGRGFLARLLQADGAELVFLDRDSGLIAQLNEAERFTVYVGSGEVPCTVEGYEAFAMDDLLALERAAEADYLFVSVGEQNLKSLALFFTQLAALTRPEDMRVVVCENGISPKNVLRAALEETPAAGCRVTQGVVFCTTIPKQGSALDILSEDFSELPYDMEEALFKLPFAHFTPVADFALLLTRKIYTYNCLSACIAYVGYVKGYIDYSQAANDPEIKVLCRSLAGQINRVLCAAYGVSLDEQRRFADNALKKFSDTAISDTIEKNARAVIRKICPNERLVGPLRMFLEAGEDVTILCMVIAAALVYLVREERDALLEAGEDNPVTLFARLSSPEVDILKCIQAVYEELSAGQDVAWIGGASFARCRA